MIRTAGKIGDVIEIPLSNGNFAAGRLYRESSIGIFSRKFRSHVRIEELVDLSIAFVVGCFDTAITKGNWPTIGNIPFDDSEDAWAPPRYIQDIINPSKYRIYHHGEMRPADPSEIAGLEKAQVYKPEQLVERIERELPLL
ncbi:Imm26 family immunity protein [Aeoliella mucimassa]|uniref:Imm26 family immunity protein n=1 Tax=Aeoliella mucimassa TaxID=2527972 RepID=UPI0018D46028|nr:Imm26 family immunity protein [Aeoliella mucimassa]